MASLCPDHPGMPLEILDEMETTITISDINAGTFICTTSTYPVDITYIVYEYTLTN